MVEDGLKDRDGDDENADQVVRSVYQRVLFPFPSWYPSCIQLYPVSFCFLHRGFFCVRTNPDEGHIGKVDGYVGDKYKDDVVPNMAVIYRSVFFTFRPNLCSPRKARGFLDSSSSMPSIESSSSIFLKTKFGNLDFSPPKPDIYYSQKDTMFTLIKKW